MSAHEKVSSPTSNKKNKWTLATFKPLIPGSSDPVFRMIQSRRLKMMPLVCHRGVHWIVSRYRPPTPEGILGVQKTAVAEWKTEISSMSSVVGQRERRGILVNVGFVSAISILTFNFYFFSPRPL